MNRVLKTVGSKGKVTYEIRHPAVQEKVLFTDEFEGAVFNVTTGDYAPLMSLVNKSLEQAKVVNFWLKCQHIEEGQYNLAMIGCGRKILLSGTTWFAAMLGLGHVSHVLVS